MTRIGGSSSSPQTETNRISDDDCRHTGVVSTPGRDDALTEALGTSQRLGFLGARPIDEVIAHARMYVRALDEVPGGALVVDIGSGGGVPGLVIAHDRPDLRLWLVDRRRKRTDFLERLVRRYTWLSDVEVVSVDVAELIDHRGGRTGSPAADRFEQRDDEVDVVVARGFGPPDETLMMSANLVRVGGLIVISEPPDGDRWSPEVLDASGTVRHETPGQRPGDRIAVFRRST